MSFEPNTFLDFLIAEEVIGFFAEPLQLKSGRKSHWYVNWRTVVGDAYLTNQLADFVIAFTKDKNLSPDGFYGVPEGATKLGIVTTFKWAQKQAAFQKGSHVLSMGRAKPKEHGALVDKYFLGEPTGKIVILEDVTTTGNSLLTTIESLKMVDCEIIAAISLTDRGELRSDGKTIAQVLQEQGVTYYALSEARNVLPRALQKLKPNEDIIRAIKKEL